MNSFCDNLASYLFAAHFEKNTCTLKGTMICRPVKIWPILGVNLRASNMITNDVKKEIKEVDITDTNLNNIYKTKKNFTGSCTQRSTRKNCNQA